MMVAVIKVKECEWKGRKKAESKTLRKHFRLENWSTERTE